MKLKLRFWAVGLLILVLGLVACGDAATATPAPSLAPITTAALQPASQLTTVPPVVATLPSRVPATVSKATTTTVAATSDSNLAKGLALFKQSSCAGCHGGDKATGKTGPALNNINFPFEGLLRQVRTGAGIMPAFSASSLPDADVHLIYDYLLSLKK